jgi:hypothetical protein
VLEQGTPDLGRCGEVELADQRHHDAAIASGVLDVHGSASSANRDWYRPAAG